jgi:hypothetical protein
MEISHYAVTMLLQDCKIGKLLDSSPKSLEITSLSLSV